MAENTTDIRKDSKEYFEIEKLKIEIANQYRPWYKKPEYLSAFLPSTIALFTLIILALNGNFNVKNELLQAKKERLELDIKSYQSLKDTVLLQLLVVQKRIKDSRSEDSILQKHLRNSVMEEARIKKYFDSLQSILAIEIIHLKEQTVKTLEANKRAMEKLRADSLKRRK